MPPPSYLCVFVFLSFVFLSFSAFLVFLSFLLASSAIAYQCRHHPPISVLLGVACQWNKWRRALSLLVTLANGQGLAQCGLILQFIGTTILSPQFNRRPYHSLTQSLTELLLLTSMQRETPETCDHLITLGPFSNPILHPSASCGTTFRASTSSKVRPCQRGTLLRSSTSSP